MSSLMWGQREPSRAPVAGVRGPLDAQTAEAAVHP